MAEVVGVEEVAVAVMEEVGLDTFVSADTGDFDPVDVAIALVLEAEVSVRAWLGVVGVTVLSSNGDGHSGGGGGFFFPLSWGRAGF